MTMRAVVLGEYGESLAVEEVKTPDLAAHGVLVETEACGVCRSDWHAWQGHEWEGDPPPEGQVLGHEPVGTVVKTGERVETLTVGDRVAVPFNLGDGTCSYCRNGHGNVCENGLALGFEPDAPGAFAERLHVPHADYNAVVLPDDVDAAAMAGLGCRFTTAYHALAHRVDLTPGDWVAVHGCGGVGLSAVHVADALGANVVAVDIKREKLERARDLGADAVVDATAEPVVETVREVTDGGANVSMDALGRAETARNSVRCLARRGDHLQVGLTTEAERGEVALPTDFMTGRDISFHGSRGMPPTRYDELLSMIQGGAVDPEKLVTRTLALDDVPGRIAAMGDYDTHGFEVVTEF